MDEITIRDFFEGRLAPSVLDRAWATAFQEEPRSDGTVVRRLRTTPLPVSFTVGTEHVIALVEAVQGDLLSLRALDAISFALEASDSFEWDTDTPDGERVAKGLFLLGTPEINYPLTPPVLAKIRHFLATGQDTLSRDDITGDRGPRRVLNAWERGA
jgi:hypothetical protein